MARVRVKTNGSEICELGRIAGECQGEFFGTWEGWYSFGFRNRHAARLFTKRLARQRPDTTSEVYA